MCFSVLSVRLWDSKPVNNFSDFLFFFYKTQKIWVEASERLKLIFSDHSWSCRHKIWTLKLAVLISDSEKLFQKADFQLSFRAFTPPSRRLLHVYVSTFPSPPLFLFISRLWKGLEHTDAVLYVCSYLSYLFWRFAFTELCSNSCRIIYSDRRVSFVSCGVFLSSSFTVSVFLPAYTEQTTGSNTRLQLYFLLYANCP